MSQTEHQTESQSEHHADAQPEPQTEPQAEAKTESKMESKFPRGLVIRLIAYLFVGHLFAFFVYLLFVLGARNQ
ncbi:DUF6126 family protein [Streptomyces sp. NPDC059989]|uniref:DUF6126 family protein n=1 Tax=Streptomyces sp. NPDC059989 TaxID=3347026 RepID=UPI003694B651